MNRLDVATAMGAIAAVGLIVDSAEMYVTRTAYAADGLFSYDVLCAGRRYLAVGRASAGLRWLYRYPTMLLLPAVQMVAAGGLLTAWLLPRADRPAIIATAALGAAFSRMLLYMRHQLGLDGADQMLVIVLVSAGLSAALGSSPAAVPFADYAALQLLLAYGVSGVAKAASPDWRSGRALVDITHTIQYGLPAVHRLLSRHRPLALAACWGTIAFECGAPLLILGGVPGAWIIIAVGLSFHVAIAIMMGLNLFVWAFAAAYPSLLLLGSQVSHILR